MNELLLVLCTFPDPEKAREIGTLLVERQLAACVNLLPGVESIYRWQGQVERASEVMAVFKTTGGAYGALAGALAELHPYEVPEIIAFRPEAVAGPFLAWVAGSTAFSPPGGPG